MPIESALVVLIPEAESLIKTFRERFDPYADTSVPAHVTILYPFLPPGEITAEVIRTLQDLFLKTPGFTISFSKIERFPDTLYLAPEPAEPFQRLTEAIVKQFPNTPPYSGEFAENIPHLTVAQVNDLRRIDEIEANFHEAASNSLPIHSRVNTILLMEKSNLYWKVRAQFPLQGD